MKQHYYISSVDISCVPLDV